MTDPRMSFGGKIRPCAHLFATPSAQNLNVYHVERSDVRGQGLEESIVFGLGRKWALTMVEDLKKQGVEAVAVQTVTGITIAGRGRTGAPNGKTAKRRAASGGAT